MKLIVKHTRTYAIAMLVVAFLCIGFTVSAQTAGSMGESQRVTLERPTQDRIVNLASNVEERLGAAIMRMEHIIKRLEVRIAKLKYEGVNTTEAEAKLTNAKNALAAAQNTLEELGSVQNAVSSDAPRESFQSIRLQFMATGNLVRQTQVGLRETVELLKDAIRITSGPGTGMSDPVQ